MGGTAPGEVLSWDNLIYVADFFETSGEKHISLLGGEPTLHPGFIEYVMYLIERGFHVNVFTSGILADKTLADAQRLLTRYTVEMLSFVCNLNHPLITSAPHQERIIAFLDAFGRYTSPGFNIYQTHPEMDFLADYINRHGLKRHLRLGLAHPIPGEHNKYVAITDMPRMIERLMSFVPLFEGFHISMGFDCGFPLCLFTDEQLGILYKLNNGRVCFGCGPAVDIGTDLSVWCCFPLSNFNKKSFYDFNSLKDIVDYYKDLHKKIRVETGGLFEKCDDCRYRAMELCSGGCIAHIVSWFKKEAPIRPAEVYP
jgi:radical SAM protein with 4Fe4S-binding SPASM domain